MENNKELIKSIRKGSEFVRSFSNMENVHLWRRAVVRLLNLVDELVGTEETEKKAEQAELI